MLRTPVSAAFQRLYKCRKSPRRAQEYVGDWPRRHAIYACELRYCPEVGEERVFVLGLLAQPGFMGFKPWQFRYVATVGLN